MTLLLNFWLRNQSELRISCWVILYFFCTLSNLGESKRWLPVKGDSQSGSMPGLLTPLGSSWWYPKRCRDKNAEVFFSKPEKNNLSRRLLSSGNKKKINKRGPGWKHDMFRDAEIILERWVDLVGMKTTCAYSIRECCFSNETRYKRRLQKHERPTFKYDTILDSELACKSKISIPRRSWGKCAFVASGAVLLRQPLGEMIDEHDTVIRLGHMPLSGWSKFVGRKTDVLIGRGSIQSKFAQSYPNLKFVIGKDPSLQNSNVIRVDPSDSTGVRPEEVQTHHGKRLIVGDPLVADILYDVATKPINRKPRGPTTGFFHVLRVILSDFCEELDIYGMSPNCGGYYYNLRTQMKLHHSCELESWVLHHIMKTYTSTKLCIFV